ncbi:serine hydrolase domain-containing protein [Phaeocystidibacter luteus]|uniref:Beta-lactamase family protein n=1 Tax=Phaeocystidibacter luteus TaxID=911197 RepID=A0A6N6RES6_9FLAO|nr:serine hydrolase domain-containing protein [Phaeocystidibacter luteus]KAB2808670.1 beta-lactamase family protein [Phaeocystidibacter luteus]
MRKLLAFSLLCASTIGFAQSAHIDAVQTIPFKFTHAYRIAGTAPEYFTSKERMDALNVRGMSIAVVKDGDVAWSLNFGLQNVKDSIPVNMQTLFQAASISKPITGIAVLHLVQEGVLDLDTDVNEYLSSWSVPESEFTQDEKVTLRRLLSHTAGVTVHGFPGYPNGTEMPSTLEVLEGEGNTPVIEVDMVPGSEWRYSGGGYVIIQQLIEDVTGVPFAEYMDTQVLPELGMNHSTFSQPIHSDYEEFASLAYHGDGTVYSGGWHNYPEIAPAGLWTTSQDLALYMRYVHRVYTGKMESDFISKALIDEMLTPYSDEFVWGLGPALEYQSDSLRMQHGGKNAGFSNIMMMYPAYCDGVVILTNSDNGRILMREAMRAVSEYYAWNADKQEVVTRAELTEEQKNTVAGRYLMENGRGYAVELVWEGEKLRITDGNPTTDEVVIPTSDSRYIDLVDGDVLEFPEGLESGVFQWNGIYTFEKED